MAGAIVELASIASEAGVMTAPRRTTNATGAFDFGEQAASEWSVRASAPGKTSAIHDVDLHDPTARPAPDRLELELGACDAALFGTIRDASGGPIASAHIVRLSADMPTSIPGLVFARAHGMVDTSPGTPVDVGVGQTSIEIKIRLEAASTLRGRVIDGDKPVAGARVVALAGRGVSPNAVSQEDGSFVLAGVPRGGTVHGVPVPGREARAVRGDPRRARRDHDPRPERRRPRRGADGRRRSLRRARSAPRAVDGSRTRRSRRRVRTGETVHLARGETKEVNIDLAYAASIAGTRFPAPVSAPR